MDHSDAIDMMLNNLDSWRHLPKYQLERRADLFFGLFIKQILVSCGYAKPDELGDPIPEFPFRYDKKNPDDPQNFLTVNFDYVLFNKKIQKHQVNSFIIELKTDLTSARERNNPYLTKVKNTDLSEIINGILLVAEKSTGESKYKYKCLIAKMLKNNIIRRENDRWEGIPDVGKPEIIYLVPFDRTNANDNKKIEALLKKGFKVIGFDQIADIIDDKQDKSFRHNFAKCLRVWNVSKAGSICHE